MVHPTVQTDDPLAPAWLDEGLGALFESPRMTPPGEIHGKVNWRLDEQGLLWPFYRAWRDSVAQDPKGEGAFGRIVGQTAAQATETRRSWVLGLTFHGG